MECNTNKINKNKRKLASHDIRSKKDVDVCANQAQLSANKYERKNITGNDYKNIEMKCIYDNRSYCNRDFVAAAFYLHSNEKYYGKKENTIL